MGKEVDCSKGLEAGCRAKCCSLNVILTQQEIEKGIVQSNKVELGKSFVDIVAKGEDDYCAYLDRENFKCKIYENRPLECREYSCVRDGRISEEVRRATKMKHLLILNS